MIIFLKELRVRKNKAWGKFWSLNNVFKNKKSSLKSKMKILESCIMPVLSYGCQTWSLTKTQTSKLQSTQRAMERKIMGIRLKDRVSNRKLRESTQSKGIGAAIKKLKFKYARHMFRMREEKWNRITTNWTPWGNKRGRGRLKTKWRDEIRNRVGASWKSITQDREKWWRIGEAYAREWADFM